MSNLFWSADACSSASTRTRASWAPARPGSGPTTAGSIEAIQDLAEYYVGKDPRRIEHHAQVIARQTHFMGSVLSAATSAMDVALWDILARSVDLPIYQLLGGKVRDKAKVFANVTGDTLDERAESARQQVAQGYHSLRTTPFFSNWAEQNASQHVKHAVEIVATIREAIGDEVDLGLEIHRNLPPEEAIMLGNELLPFRILYYEDPLAPESFEALEYVARHVNLPLAFGERNYSLYQFRELINSGSRQLDPIGLEPGRRLHPGAQDRGAGRSLLCQHLSTPDGQPGQHGRLCPV